MSEQKKIKQLEEENRRLKDAIGALTEIVKRGGVDGKIDCCKCV